MHSTVHLPFELFCGIQGVLYLRQRSESSRNKHRKEETNHIDACGPQLGNGGIGHPDLHVNYRKWYSDSEPNMSVPTMRIDRYHPTDCWKQRGRGRIYIAVYNPFCVVIILFLSSVSSR